MKTRYECELCGKVSTDRKEIETCEARGIAPLGVDVKPGDIVYTPGGGYGWWSSDREWFLESRGDPKPPSHLVRAQLGFPLWVVLDILPDRDVSDHPSHQSVAVLYSPRHANYKGGVACGWTGSGHRSLVRHGEVSPEDLERYRADARARFEFYPRVHLI